MPYLHQTNIAQFREALATRPPITCAELVDTYRAHLPPAGSPQDISCKARRDYYHDLEQTLSSYYQNNIYNRKTTWETICYYLGSVDAGEKALLAAQAELRKNKKINEKLVHTAWRLPWPLALWQTLNRWVGIDIAHPKEIDKLDPQNKHSRKLSILSSRLMGTQRFREEHLQGARPDFVAYKLKQEINKFHAHYTNQLNPVLTEKLQEVDNLLQNYLKIVGQFTLSHDLLNQAGNANPENQRARFADICYEVKQSLYHLPIGKKCLIPFGFSHAAKGHAALLQFEKLDQNRLAMTVINTGAGALDQAGFFRWIRAIWWREGAVYVVDDLTLDEIIQTPLIPDLLRPLHFSSSVEEMSSPLNRLHAAGRLKESSQSLVLQTNGTCGYESLFTWLQLIWPPTLFQCFRHFLLERSLDKLDKLKAKAPSSMREVLNRLSLAGKTQKTEAQEKIPLSHRQAQEALPSHYRELLRLAPERLSSSTVMCDISNPQMQRTSPVQFDFVTLRANVNYAEQAYRQCRKLSADASLLPPSLFSSAEAKALWKTYEDKQRIYALAETITQLEAEQILTTQVCKEITTHRCSR